jgi:hypothetical protein
MFLGVLMQKKAKIKRRSGWSKKNGKTCKIRVFNWVRQNVKQNVKVPCALKLWLAPYENPIPKSPSTHSSTQRCLSIHCTDTEAHIHLQQQASITSGSQGERRRGINHSELVCCTLCRTYHSDTLYEHRKETMTDWYQHLHISEFCEEFPIAPIERHLVLKKLEMW